MSYEERCAWIAHQAAIRDNVAVAPVQWIPFATPDVPTDPHPSYTDYLAPVVPYPWATPEDRAKLVAMKPGESVEVCEESFTRFVNEANVYERREFKFVPKVKPTPPTNRNQRPWWRAIAIAVAVVATLTAVGMMVIGLALIAQKRM